MGVLGVRLREVTAVKMARPSFQSAEIDRAGLPEVPLTRATGQLARARVPRFLNSSPSESNSCHRMLSGSLLLLPSHPKFTSPPARSSRPRPGARHHRPSLLRQDRTARPAHRRARAPLPPKQVRLELLAPSRCSPPPPPPRYWHRKCRSAWTWIDSFFREQSCVHHCSDLVAAVE